MVLDLEGLLTCLCHKTNGIGWFRWAYLFIHSHFVLVKKQILFCFGEVWIFLDPQSSILCDILFVTFQIQKNYNLLNTKNVIDDPDCPQSCTSYKIIQYWNRDVVQLKICNLQTHDAMISRISSTIKQ